MGAVDPESTYVPLASGHINQWNRLFMVAKLRG